MNIFFFEAFEEEEKAIKRYLPADVQAEFTWKTIQESNFESLPALLISIRTQSCIPQNWAGNLSGILTRSTGYDHLERYCRDVNKVIPCGYLPLYCNRAVAEQAMLLWMALLRKLLKQLKQFEKFHRDGLTGSECEGKNLLVVGVGNIGSEVVKIGKGLGMQVMGVDIVHRYDWINYVSIEEGISKADIIVCAMNLTSDNQDYFHYHLFKSAPKGVLFINIARGELSPPSDLYRLLEEGHLGGVALDVYSEESLMGVALRNDTEPNSETVKATLSLRKFSNVIMTPHNAFNTMESVERKSDHAVQQVLHFLKSGKFLWPIPAS